MTIDLSKLPPLASGSHKSINDGMCIMEAVAYVAGEPWSDSPACACPVISIFLRTWNDALPDDERNTLLRPFVPLLIGTRGHKALERRRAAMAADWIIRDYTPAWLRLAGLTTQANALAAMPEITDFASCPSLMPTLNAVKKDAAAAWDAAWDAARAAAGDAAGAAAGAAAWAAARAAAGAAERRWQSETLFTYLKDAP